MWQLLSLRSIQRDMLELFVLRSVFCSSVWIVSLMALMLLTKRSEFLRISLTMRVLGTR